jgi:hypothetical protein
VVLTNDQWARMLLLLRMTTMTLLLLPYLMLVPAITI